MRQLRLVVCLLLLGLFVRVEAQSGQANEIIRLVNQVRSGQGLIPFQTNSQLSVAAQTHAEWMAVNVSYTHTGAGGSTPQDRANQAGYSGRVSENIVGGTNMTPNQGVIWWQNSTVHFNTMTSTYYSEIGAGFATNGSQNFYVIVVGNPTGAQAGTNTTGNAQPAPIVVTPIPLSTPNPDGSIFHEVLPSQALWTLAAYYDVEVDFLMRLNNFTENDFVQPGDIIQIRLADNEPTPTPLPTPTPPLTHEVREGQALWTIAALYGLSLEELLLLNGMNENSFIQAGDVLRVRLAEGETLPPTATPPTTHVVQSGDTGWSIANRYGLTLDELLALNGLAEDSLLQVGDVLQIRTPDPTATATSLPTATNTVTPAPLLRATETTEATILTTPSPTTVTTIASEVAQVATETPAPTDSPTPELSEEPETPVLSQSLLSNTNLLLLLGLSSLLLAIALWLRWRYSLT